MAGTELRQTQVTVSAVTIMATWPQHPSTQLLPALHEPATLRIRQPQAPACELTPKCPVFLDQISDDVLILSPATAWPVFKRSSVDAFQRSVTSRNSPTRRSTARARSISPI